MSPFSLSGLRTRLGLLVLIAVVPAFLFIVYIQSTDRRRAREQTAEGNLGLAQFAASEESSVLIGATRLLQTIADFPALFEDLDACTYADAEKFFSYRRMTHSGEADYGRHVNAIVLT